MFEKHPALLFTISVLANNKFLIPLHYQKILKHIRIDRKLPYVTVYMNSLVISMLRLLEFIYSFHEIHKINT